MKRIAYIAFFLLLAVNAHSQNEVPADSVRRSPLSQDVKEFDGFLLDMSLLKTSVPVLPAFKLEMPTSGKDYNSIFRLNPDVTYTQGFSNVFSLTPSTVYSLNPFGLTGFGASPQHLQMGSFKLKNGMRINTYGEYNKDGWKVRNPSALPWERNNFKGAFELKSANGSFGIRIEVQQGNKTPY